MSDQGETTITNHRKPLASLFGTRRRLIVGGSILAAIIVAVIIILASRGSSAAADSDWFQTADGDIRCIYVPDGDAPTMACLSQGTQATIVMRNDGNEAHDAGPYVDSSADTPPVLEEGVDYWTPGKTFLCTVHDVGNPAANVTCVADSMVGFQIGTNSDGSAYRATGSGEYSNWTQF
jgi:hypothetical protein